LKRMVDHLIQNISPFFTKIRGEVHHQRRYPTSPNLLVIGWQREPDPAAEAVLRHLVARNAINLYAAAAVCGVLAGDPGDLELARLTGEWLNATTRGTSSPVPPLPAPPLHLPLAGAGPIARAALLVGSPRTRTSTSYSLGSYLMARLAQHGTDTDIVQIYTAMGSGRRRAAALDLVDAADLVVLAAPLYVDSLPAPVTATLERIAAQPAPTGPANLSRDQRFAAILNCGFPEAAHTATALAICAQFARQRGMTSLGGLALGAGEGIVHGTPIDELGRRGTSIRRALDLAAAALAAGRPIPTEAVDLMARPAIPKSLYTLVGGYGWRRAAHRNGVRARLLRDRPYQDADYHRPARRVRG
ncbi:NAD(P)H-dependent oxidoreductase, partial [Actinophytocola sp.]|uniref:NAD(P)H-dependent oxidoreductase n=1 Tax=Actinophytocola sp. TaxID=1872138 RepID=UPI002D7FFFAC